MTVPRYSIRVMYVVGEGYSSQAINHLVKQALLCSKDRHSSCLTISVTCTLDCLSNKDKIDKEALFNVPYLKQIT